MAFGSTLSPSANASAKEQEKRASVFFNEAWSILPNLIMQHDLWALKSVTLMVGGLTVRSHEEEATDAYI